MSNTIRIEHDGKSYELKPKTITGGLLEEIAPIRAQQKALSQALEIQQAAMDDPEIFALIDPTTGDLRDGYTQVELMAVMARNPRLLKAIQAPTTELQTTPEGIDLMAQIIRATVDRAKFSEGLSKDIDSASLTKGKATKRSEFWTNFDVTVMMDYVESFCRRARI